MIKVLDLFAGTQSVKKALTEKYEITNGDYLNGIGRGFKFDGKTPSHNTPHIIEYIGIDIYSPEDENTILDLTQDNIVEKLSETLKEGEPNFIGASPICNKFSAATTGPNGNTYFVVDKTTNSIRERERNEYAYVKHNKFNEKQEKGDKFVVSAKLAMKLHKNNKAIIDYFNVPFAIENPANALSKYIYKDYVRNITHYSAYGFEYKKPTAIYSNIELGLKKGLAFEGQRILKFDRINKTDKGPNHGDKNVSTYANRSSVPPKLIKEILEQTLNKGDK